MCCLLNIVDSVYYKAGRGRWVTTWLTSKQRIYPIDRLTRVVWIASVELPSNVSLKLVLEIFIIN